MKSFKYILNDIKGYINTILIFKYQIIKKKNIQIQGKIDIDFKSVIFFNSSTKLFLNGNIKIRKSNFLIINSTVDLNSGSLHETKMNVFDSDLILGEGFKLKNITLDSKSSKILGKRSFCLDGIKFEVRNSKCDINDYFLYNNVSYHACDFIINNSRVQIGENVRLQCATHCDNSEFIIGSHVFINYGTEIRCHKKIIIGSYILISYECLIFDTNTHSTNPYERMDEILKGYPNNTSPVVFPVKKEISIGDNVWVGMRAAILKGSVINNNCIVSMYGVVTGTVPENYLAYGNPFKTKMLQFEGKNN